MKLLPLKGELRVTAVGVASNTLGRMDALRIIPLGGLGEVGKNLTVYELGDEIVVVDAGLAFPRDEHLGVDLVLPDYTYLRERADRVRAVLLTHAHEDHVGGLPYLMREVSVPEVWGTRLTLGLVQPKLDEHGLLHATELKEARPEDGSFQVGSFKFEYVRMAHSVPDTAAILIETPDVRVLHTGDYKLDHTPVDGLRTDVGKLAEIGNRGVDLLLGDSTNAERPGVTGSERLVGEAFRQIIPVREGRILVACFASNVHRMQQAVDVAIETGRKVCVVGRSMRKNLNIARNLGYLEAPDDTDLAPGLDRDVDCLLHAVDVRGETRDEDATFPHRDDLAESLADKSFGARDARTLRVRRVAQEQVDTAVSDLRELADIGPEAVDRRVVELVVPGVQDAKVGCLDEDRRGVRNRVRHADVLEPERADLEGPVLGAGLLQLRRVQQPVLVELGLDEAERQARPPDLGHGHLAHEIRQAAHVVLVGMCEQHGAHTLGALPEVGVVRQDEIDAQVLVARERETRVHDDDLVSELVDGQVLADLAESPEGDNSQRLHTAQSIAGCADGRDAKFTLRRD